MTRRTKLWLASLFTLINLGGGIFAAVGGEGLHAAVHGVLLLLGVYWMLRTSPRAAQQASLDTPDEERLARLQQSLDAIAIEVERIGEAQRFIAKLEQERAEKRS